MCKTEGRSVVKFIPRVSFMWPIDGCLNQKSFCFYAEMWALDSTQLLSIAFVLVPTSPLSPFFALFLLQPHWSLFQSCLLLPPSPSSPLLSPHAVPLYPTFLFFPLYFLVCPCYPASCVVFVSHPSFNLTSPAPFFFFLPTS